VPPVPGRKKIFHSNRTVIHPDYQGFGIGIKVISLTSKYMVEKYDYKIMAKFSSTPVYKAMIKQPDWRFLKIIRTMGKMNQGGTMAKRVGTFREYGSTSYSFEYIGENSSILTQNVQKTIKKLPKNTKKRPKNPFK